MKNGKMKKNENENDKMIKMKMKNIISCSNNTC